ncbi:MAG: fasciclin domain-containing protein [Prevotella sp.]|nr:fasciclin domain-containing protein [Prevotella sp.]
MKQYLNIKTKKFFNFLVYILLPLAGGGWVGVSCTDTWDDHYESLGGGEGEATLHEGTLWEAINNDPDLKNFAEVIKGCEFDKTLNSSQVFTVFAPTNDKLPKEQVQRLIDEYKQQVAEKVVEEDNTALKEFIYNHVSLYNHSVSRMGSDSIVLMNGKYALLNYESIDGNRFITKNQLYTNGVLFKVSDQVSYLPSVFEYLRKDPDLDSVYRFLYDSHFYYREFQDELSVPGSIVDGKTQYLDSVFMTRNELFTYLGRLNSEDSSYIMVAPTNEVWKELIEEYEPYFNYPEGIDKRDSFVYTNSRLAIMRGTTFSRTFNSDETLQDSCTSESSSRDYNSRRSQWGGLPFEYFQYRKPLEQPTGVLAQTDIVQCSNGEVRKATRWNIDKRMTFNQFIRVDVNNARNVKELSKMADSHGDQVPTVSEIPHHVNSDNSRFYNKLWNNVFVEYSPNFSTVNHQVLYYLRDVLSNVGYDIYMVVAPVLAADSNAIADVRVPTKLRFTLQIPGQKDEVLKGPDGKDVFTTVPDSVYYMLLAEDYKFPVCTYGLDDEDKQILLRMETRVTSPEQRNKMFTRTVYANCFLLVPHGTLELVDALPDLPEIKPTHRGTPGVMLYPHGQYTDRVTRWWYMQR